MTINEFRNKYYGRGVVPTNLQFRSTDAKEFFVMRWSPDCIIKVIAMGLVPGTRTPLYDMKKIM